MTNPAIIFERVTALLAYAERQLQADDYKALCQDVLDRVEADATSEETPSPVVGDDDSDPGEDDSDIITDDDEDEETLDDDDEGRRYDQRQHRYKD